jgi:hypothetical protein
MPLIIGLLNPLSKERIRHSLLTIIKSVNFLLSILLSFYFVKAIFSDTENSLNRFLDKHLSSAGDLISQYQHDIVAFVIVMFVLMCAIYFILELLAIPIYRHVISPITNRISSASSSMNSKTKRVFSGLWQLPKAVCMVLVFSLLLNFYTNFINNPSANSYIEGSTAYHAISKNLLQPILSANLVKNAPAQVSDAFRKAAEDFTPSNTDSTGAPNYWNLPAIKFFNGMTIDEAVKSSTEIDDMAKQIVGNEKDDKEKAYLLYSWVSRNIRYDKAKAEIVMKTPSRVNSGSIITYQERTGVCFDYSCLYVSMCRAVDLKVRLVSGLGYSGKDWGEHVWNQVYIESEKKWINVDATFGNSSYNYFDTDNFSDSHRYDVIQAEW